MERKELLVIRIGISLEGPNETQVVTVPVTVGVTPTAQVAKPPPEAIRAEESAPPSRAEMPADAPPANSPPPPTMPRFRGRDERPTEARQGDDRAMTDAQRKALFRLAYGLGDRDSAVDRVLAALGVDRLEWATRVQASRAIDALRFESEKREPDRPTNGSHHA